MALARHGNSPSESVQSGEFAGVALDGRGELYRSHCGP